MSVVGYCFSKIGLSHEEGGIPCQDYSGILKKGAWKLAIIADGVGSCKHSDIASKIAVETASKVVNAAFPYEGDEDFLALIRIAMHSAENAIQNYALKNNQDINDFHTTLAMALYNGTDLFYGNAGDSGIVALDEFGEYHIITSKQNNEYGDVHTLAERKFEVGKATFKAAAVFCMTDGLLDWVVPKSLHKHKYKIHVPRASVFVRPEFWGQNKTNEDEMIIAGKKVESELTTIVNNLSSGLFEHQQYGDLREGNLKDDLSVVVLINTNSMIDPKSISWVPLADLTVEEKYLEHWRKLKTLYPAVAKKKFIEYITECNCQWNEDSVFEFASRIWKMDSDSTQNIQYQQPNGDYDQSAFQNSELQADSEWSYPTMAESVPKTDSSPKKKRGFLSSFVDKLIGEDNDNSENE